MVIAFYFNILSADIYDKVEAEIESLGLKSECVGGGRIQHDRTDKKILVYGYSMVNMFFVCLLFYLHK